MPSSRHGRAIPDPRGDSADVRVRAFLRKVGATDLHAWLGISPHTPHREALVHLERRRRALEAAMDDPQQAQEIDLFLDSYDLIRDALVPRVSPHEAARRTHAPDYYAILGTDARASYAELEAAFKGLSDAGRADDPLVAQAWRVLGDPLNRANYDRSRNARARAASNDEPTFEPDPITEVAATHVRLLRLPGPPEREVVLDGRQPITRDLPLVVAGEEPVTVEVVVDHPCLSVWPEHDARLTPGRHTLSVTFDPRRASTSSFACSVTVMGADAQATAVFRVRRPLHLLPERLRPWLLAMLALSLVFLGWTLGSLSPVQTLSHAPASVGRISQLPTAAACLDAQVAPLPSHVDVHTDGFGRPTGFSFGGVASPKVESCIRDALTTLDFPPTRDGLPVYHRYRIPAVEDVRP